VNAVEKVSNRDFGKVACRFHGIEVATARQTGLIGKLLKFALRKFQLCESIALNEKAGPEETEDTFNRSRFV
jgi:hypothetical protein